MEVFAKGMAAAFIIAWLVYRSYYGMILILVTIPIFYRLKKREKGAKRSKALRAQFREMMRLLADALEAGYSMEKAFAETERELSVLYGEDEDIRVEAGGIMRRLNLKVSAEESLYDFANRTGDKDIIGFARIMSFARKSGGNHIQIIRNSIRVLEEKEEAEQEIETFLADKILEAKMMCVMPVIIMVMLTLQSTEYLKPLYNNAFGIILMSGMLVIYCVAALLALKLSNIEV